MTKYLILIVLIIIACYYYNIKIDVKVDKNNKHYQETLKEVKKRVDNGLDSLK
jgi:hypothetical protein